jgi:hypothetical protein
LTAASLRQVDAGVPSDRSARQRSGSLEVRDIGRHGIRLARCVVTPNWMTVQRV